MGSVTQLSRRRVTVPASLSAGGRRGSGRAAVKARDHDDDSRKSLMILVVVFTATAIAMSASVVVAGSNSWAEAMPLIVFVSVFALTKIFLANALFFVMIRSDKRSEAVAADAASKAKAAGMVIRRPRTPPPALRRTTAVGARPRRGGPSSTVRLAILAGKPAAPDPRRTKR